MRSVLNGRESTFIRGHWHHRHMMGWYNTDSDYYTVVRDPHQADYFMGICCTRTVSPISPQQFTRRELLSFISRAQFKNMYSYTITFPLLSYLSLTRLLAVHSEAHRLAYPRVGSVASDYELGAHDLGLVFELVAVCTKMLQSNLRGDQTRARHHFSSVPTLTG